MNLLFLAGLLLPAAAADFPPESVRLDVEHQQLCARASILIDAVEAARAAYVGAPDPDAALDRWTRAMAEAKDAANAADALAHLHRKSRGALEVAQVADTLTTLSKSGSSAKVDLAQLEAVARADDAIGFRNQKVMGRLYYESRYLIDAQAARAAARAQESGRRQVRARVLSVAALLAALSAVVVWALRR